MTSTTLNHTTLRVASYDPVLKILHWLMALLFLTAVAIGAYCSTIEPGVPPRPALLDIHKSIGVTLFVLVFFRAAWRLTHPSPPLPPRFGPATRLASACVHGALYLAMLGMPLSGYINSMAGGHPFRWFDLFPVPDLLARDKPLSHLGETAHWFGAWAVYTLVALHIGAALWHVLRRDGVVRRMI